MLTITTTNNLDGYEVVEYLGIVTGEAVSGINMFRDIGAGLRNVFGGRSAGYEDEMSQAREEVLNEMSQRAEALDLDNIVAVVDCARMWDEFHGGRDLLADNIDEDDIEALLIQQLEFCTTVVLNKCDTVTREQIDELKGIVRSLQKEAVIVEAEQGNVDLDQILDTNRFDFNQAYGSAAWLDAMEHPEEHDDPEVLEYGIETFVYDRRRPFDIDRFADYVRTWPKEIIRAKGQLWSAQDPDMCYMFEQAGQQSMLSEQGKFIASAPDDIRARLIAENPEVMDDWDETCGDRETKICFIGQHMDKQALVAGLDACLVDWQH